METQNSLNDGQNEMVYLCAMCLRVGGVVSFASMWMVYD